MQAPADHGQAQTTGTGGPLLPGDAATLAERIRAANAGYVRARELDLDDAAPGVRFDPRWT